MPVEDPEFEADRADHSCSLSATHPAGGCGRRGILHRFERERRRQSASPAPFRAPDPDQVATLSRSTATSVTSFSVFGTTA
jgi:hypothetical protein